MKTLHSAIRTTGLLMFLAMLSVPQARAQARISRADSLQGAGLVVVEQPVSPGTTNAYARLFEIAGQDRVLVYTYESAADAARQAALSAGQHPNYDVFVQDALVVVYDPETAGSGLLSLLVQWLGKPL